MIRRTAPGLSLAAALALATGAAHGDNPPAKGGLDATALDDVIVTAQRRAQAAGDVSISISTLSDSELVAHGFDSVNQLDKSVSNLRVIPQFGGGQPKFEIRGVGFEDYATNNAPTVGVYVDEVALPLPVMTQGQLFDLERVEVLRGPQGTLYGRNTTGGAINFITRKPSAELSGGTVLEYGRFGRWRADAFLSGPVAAGVKLRFAVTTEQGGAWQKNRDDGRTLGDAARTAARAIADWQPAAEVDVELSLGYGRDRSDGQGLYLLTPFKTGSGPVIAADADHSLTGWGTNAPFARLLGIAVDRQPFRDNTQTQASLRLDWTLPGARLTSLTSYQHLDRREYNDWDASASSESETYFASRIGVASEELRLISSGGGPLEWLGGLYLAHESLQETYRSGFGSNFGFNAATPYAQDATTHSLFGQAEYKASARVNLILGLRYEDEQRDLKNLATTATTLVGFVVPHAVIGVDPTSRTTQFRQASGRAGIEFRPPGGALYYATLSRGVKSGGFTAYNTLNTAVLAPFRPEILWAYEAGFKADFAGRSLLLNGAAFYYDYRDQQVQSVFIDPVFGAIGQIVNARQSAIYGAELELSWRPVPALKVRQSLGYDHGTYRNFVDVDVQASLATQPFTTVHIQRAGQDLGNPQLSYCASVAYLLALPALGIEPALDYSYRDRLTSRLGDLYNVAGYGLLDARVTFAPQHAAWTVAAFGHNVLNKRYDATRNFFVTANLGVSGVPATYGARFTYRF